MDAATDGDVDGAASVPGVNSASTAVNERKEDFISGNEKGRWK